jgi:glycosyltransferase involved in cell wall biosynthesis
LKLVILIPAFNEEKTISDVIKSIGTSFPKINEIEVLVIDDGSTDKTADVARSCGALVYSFTQNKGLAKAISYGFSKARERKADILVILDADNQYDPNEIPLLLDPILGKKADIVLGDRKIMKLDHMPLQKKIGNKLSSRVVSKLMGQRINDAQTGFRAFNQDAINKLHIFSGYTYTQETLLQAKYKGLKILEVPVAFRRRNDKSRLISNIFTYAFRTISLIASTIIFYKSFKFFGILTVILFGIGVGLSVFLLNHFYTTGNINPYYPTTVLAAIFLITAAICTLMTIISLIMNRQSILLEEINQKLNKSTF